MASKAITIKNYKDAVDKGVIPGSFSKDRLEFNFKVVESVNSRRKKITWAVKVRLLNKNKEALEIKDSYLIDSKKQLPNDWKAEITVDSKQEGGKTREAVATFVATGKNIGKSNATNIVTQALRDALSLYNKQLKKGNSGVNIKMVPPPMTLKKINASKSATLTDKDFDNGITVQRKFNGVRVVAYYDWDKKEVKFYSRAGHDYPGMDHIRKELEAVLSKPPPIEDLVAGNNPENCEIKDPKIYYEETRLSKEENEAIMKVRGKQLIVYLDGEFYLHGKPLNFISGQSRNAEAETRLEYHIYDCFFPTAIAVGDNLVSKCRQKYLKLIFDRLKSAYHVQRVEDFKAKNNKHVHELCDIFIKEGYEGAVARKDLGIYQYSYNNYHSSMVIKIKKVHDDEFNIVGFTEGSKGKDKGALIWIAEVDEKTAKIKDDRKFNVVPKEMTYEERKKMFKCLSEKVVNPTTGKEITVFERDYLGTPLTVEYSEISEKTGKPLQPKAITVRTYEDPNTDPVKKMYERCKITEGGSTDINVLCVERIDFVH
jgi:ATP-dependent DNA ligase